MSKYKIYPEYKMMPLSGWGDNKEKKQFLDALSADIMKLLQEVHS